MDLERWKERLGPERQLAEGLAETTSYGSLVHVLRWFNTRMDQWEGRTALLAERTAEQLGLTVSDLIDGIETDPRSGELLAVAMEAAVRSTSTQKIFALSRVLANAFEAEGPAAVDEQELLLRAIAELEAPDVRALGALASWPSAPLHPGEVFEATFPNASAVQGPILAKLTRLGLFESGGATYGGGAVHGVSTFGLAVMRLLEECAPH